jgi:prepilin-type N-terminal cleavage/methylation domain-containing protein
MSKTERGFTLIELVVVGSVVGLLCAVAFWLIRPADYSAVRRNAERYAGTAQLLQALNRYVQEHNGQLPAGFTDKPQVIGSEEGMLNLCPALVPDHLPSIPLDPLDGAIAVEIDCRAKDAGYLSGYTARRGKDGMVTIEAPSAENGEHIRQARKF